MNSLIIHGDCAKVMPKLASGTFDAVICDPPYPCLPRSYGTMNERDWHAMMEVVVPECRRVIKPTGSAVFILQPNSKRAGEMRLWLWEFIVRWGREWNLVQDAYWWNYATLPTGGATQQNLLRSSVKMCVWLGAPDCYRDQDAVLWGEADETKRRRLASRPWHRQGFTSPSSNRPNAPTARTNAERIRAAAISRGGVTPFNLLPASNTATQIQPESTLNLKPHPARTPAHIVDWWIRYLTPEGGSVLDPFCGSGTTVTSAVELGRTAVGIEKDSEFAAGAAASLSFLT